MSQEVANAPAAIFTVEQAERLVEKAGISKTTVFRALGLMDNPAVTSEERALLDGCRVFDDAMDIYYGAHPDSAFEHHTLIKCLELASTLDEASRVYQQAPMNSGLEDQAIRRMAELLP